jgi:membrane associated rhomboid family serine protease
MSQLQQWLNPRSSAAKMAVLFVVCSLVYYLTEQWTGEWVPLTPDRVIGSLTLWQLISYSVLFQRSVVSFLFGVLILVSTGGALERHWGAKRLWMFAFGVSAAAGGVTVLLSLLVPSIGAWSFMGADLIVLCIWVAFGLLVGRGQTNFWGMPITGNTLALIGASFVVLDAILSRQWKPFIPHFVALALTYLHVRLGFPHDALQRFGSWRLQRDLSKRSSHLRVISGDQRNTSRDSDKFLH